MKSSSVRAFYQLAMLMLLLLTAIVQPAAFAQESKPASPPASTPTTTDSGDDQQFHGAIFDPEAPSIPSASAAAEPADEAMQNNTPTPSPEPYKRQTPDSGVQPQGVQGPVTLDVAVAEKVRPGEVLRYTFAYTNNGASVANNVVVDATWTNFSTATAGAMQYCDLPTQSSQACQPETLAGPAVTKEVPPSGSSASMRYRIGALNPGQSGSFAVQLRIRNDFYPQTNQPYIKPAGSGQLYVNNAYNVVVSEDTADSTVIGPVFNLYKEGITTETIYPASTGTAPPNSNGTFRITLGNATGTGDMPNGKVRVDAIAANNIEIIDYIPRGSKYVSSSIEPFNIDTTNGVVTWKLSGSLEPGASRNFTVTYQKLDAIDGGNCDIRNEVLKATSDEYLITGKRFDVNGQGAMLRVQIPLDFKNFSYTPERVYFGNVSDVTVTVRNYWPKPINGLMLRYDIQSNAYFVQSSTNVPVPSRAPTGQNPGGRVEWDFNMPAGSAAAPSEAKFTVRLRGAFEFGTDSWFSLLVPGDIPSACLPPQKGTVPFAERLLYSKSTDVDPKTWLGNSFTVSRGQEFPYTITIQNRTSQQATGVSILDLIPDEEFANFSYVVKSATLTAGTANAVQIEPTTVVNGRGGRLEWKNITVPGNTTVYLRYKLRVDGRDYYRYCNLARVSKDPEPVARGDDRVCVKINPQVRVTKTIVNSNGTPTQTTANPGDEVRFQLTLTNLEPTAYDLGLIDRLNNYTFVRQESGYANPVVRGSGSDTYLEWPTKVLNQNESISAIIVAKLPVTCATVNYGNQALLRNPTDIIVPLPEVIASAQVTCSQIEYNKSADRQLVSLKDQLGYTLQVRNGSGTAANNITIEDFLPQGFTYVGMQSGSDIKAEPAKEVQPSGRTKLTWALATLGPQTTTRVSYYARSGDVVGTFENWLRVPTGAICNGNCKVVDNTTYAYSAVTVQPLITMEPTISTTGCVLPGARPVYRLTIINTNVHEYANTNVDVKLPFGLRFVRPLNSTPTPTTTTDANGVSTVSWANLKIAAKPGNGIATQVQLEIELLVGQVWGDLDTIVTTTSPDGSIPRKDSTLNPTVPVCPPKPAVAKDADKYTVKSGDQVFYQITLANTTNSPLTVSVQDQLPSNFSYIAGAPGKPAPSVNGNTLSWQNVIIPAAANNKAGILILQFTVRVNTALPAGVYPNTAVVSGGGVQFDTQYATIIVRSPSRVYLPWGMK